MRVEAKPTGRGGCPGSWPLLERPLEFEHAKTAETRVVYVVFFLSGLVEHLGGSVDRKKITYTLAVTERK